MKKSLTVSFLLVMLAMPSFAHADLLLPGTKWVNYCFRIENIDDYPDYIFLLRTNFADSKYGDRPPQAIRAGDCLYFYKLLQPSIYAIGKSEFSESDIDTENPTEIREYFDSNANLIKSGFSFRMVSLIDENDPTKSIVDVFRIVSLNESGLVIEKEKVVYTFTDGGNETVPYVNQDEMPAHSRPVPEPASDSWYVIPLLALAAIALIVVIRRTRK